MAEKRSVLGSEDRKILRDQEMTMAYRIRNDYEKKVAKAITFCKEALEYAQEKYQCKLEFVRYTELEDIGNGNPIYIGPAVVANMTVGDRTEEVYIYESEYYEDGFGTAECLGLLLQESLGEEITNTVADVLAPGTFKVLVHDVDVEEEPKGSIDDGLLWRECDVSVEATVVIDSTVTILTAAQYVDVKRVTRDWMRATDMDMRIDFAIITPELSEPGLSLDTLTVEEYEEKWRKKIADTILVVRGVNFDDEDDEEWDD